MNLSGELKILLVDTGAEVSILREAIPGIPVPPARICAREVTGAPLSVLGVQEVECRVANRRVSHCFVIADVKTSYEGLIGWDLLRKLGAVVDAAEGTSMEITVWSRL